MKSGQTRKLGGAITLALSAVGPVSAQWGGPPRQQSGSFTAEGPTAICQFPVRIDQTGGAQVQFLEGKGFRLYLLAGDSGNTKFTNLTTNQSFTLQSRGGTFSERANGDGTTTLTMTGTFVNAWFPADTPSQTTILYKGRAVVLRTPNGDFLQSAVGTQSDICALIS
jgi:hypothetical protein